MAYYDKCTPEELEMGEWNPGGGEGGESMAATAVGIVLAVMLCIGCLLMYIDQGGEAGYGKKALRAAESMPGSTEHTILQGYRCRRTYKDDTTRRGFLIEYKRRGEYEKTRYCCSLFSCNLD